MTFCSLTKYNDNPPRIRLYKSVSLLWEVSIEQLRRVCGMPTRDTYISLHLVLSHLGLAFVLFVETKPFTEFVVIFFRTMHFELPSVLSRFRIVRNEFTNGQNSVIILQSFWRLLHHNFTGQKYRLTDQMQMQSARSKLALPNRRQTVTYIWIELAADATECAVSSVVSVLPVRRKDRKADML